MRNIPAWFERTFDSAFPVEQYPNLCSRLRGTPARLEEIVSGAPRKQAALQVSGNPNTCIAHRKLQPRIDRVRPQRYLNLHSSSRWRELHGVAGKIEKHPAGAALRLPAPSRGRHEQ
jgi:hypothetical protein